MSGKGALAGEFEIKVKLRTLGGLGQLKIVMVSDGTRAESSSVVMSRYDAERAFIESKEKLLGVTLKEIFPTWDIERK